MNVLLVIVAVLLLGVPCMGVMATTHLMTRPPWHHPSPPPRRRRRAAAMAAATTAATAAATGAATGAAVGTAVGPGAAADGDPPRLAAPARLFRRRRLRLRHRVRAPPPPPTLTRRHLPAGWAAANRDPLVDLGLPYTSVEFPQSADGGGDDRLTLRGWLVPGATAADADAAATTAAATAAAAATAKAAVACEDSSTGSVTAATATGAAAVDAVRGRAALAPPYAGTRSVVVAVHGGGRDRRAFLRHTGAIFHPAGLDTLLFDCAGHGLSDARRPWPLSTWPGRALSWGTREHADVAGAVAWARQSGYERVVVVATSQGAASTLIAAARAAGARLAPPPRSWWASVTGWGGPKPAVVQAGSGAPGDGDGGPLSGGGGPSRPWADALILENPFSRQESLAAHVAGMVFARLFRWPIVGPPRLALRRAWVRLAVALSMWRTGNVGRRRLRPLDMVPAVRLPMLFMHGTGDTLVPHSHSVELIQAVGGHIDDGRGRKSVVDADGVDAGGGNGSGSGLESDRSKSSGSDGDGDSAGRDGHGRRRASERRARLWLAKGAGHTLLFDAYPNEYARQVLNFLDDVAPPPVRRGRQDGDGEVAARSAH